MKIILVFLITLCIFASVKSAKDICLCCGASTVSQNMDTCETIATAVTLDDVKMLKNFCKIKAKNGALRAGLYFDKMRFLSLTGGWIVHYLPEYPDFCEIDIDEIAESLIWVTKLRSNDIASSFYLGRKVMSNATNEVISQLGMLENFNYYNGLTFYPFNLDGYPDISTFDGTYQFLCRRLPMSYAVSNPIKFAESETEIGEDYIGYITYYNPSNYPQNFSTELQFPVQFMFEVDGSLIQGTPLKYQGLNKTYEMRAGYYFEELQRHIKNFNETVNEGETVKARIWGVWIRHETSVYATLNTTYLELGGFVNYTVKNVTGKEIDIRFGRFYFTYDYMEDHEYNCCPRANFTQMYIIFFSMGFALVLFVIYHVVQIIRKIRRRKYQQEAAPLLDDDSILT